MRVEGRGVCGGWRREGREFSLSEWEVGSSWSSASLKFMGIRVGGLEVVGGGRVVVFWGESWAIGVLE